MLERFVWDASSDIATAVAAWIGLAAFLTRLRRFGLYVKFPLWLLFVIRWAVATTFTGFLGESWATKRTSFVTVPAFIISILFYLASLPIRKNREGKKSN